LDGYPRLSEKSYMDKTLTAACKLVSGDQQKRKEAHKQLDPKSESKVHISEIKKGFKVLGIKTDE